MIRAVVLLGMAVLGAALIIILPKVRDVVWAIDGPTVKTSLPYDPDVRAAQEAAVTEAMKVDESKYDRTSDTRTIDKLLTSDTELEAVFRQRKADIAEKLLPGDFVESRELLANLTPRDLSRPSNNRIPSTRRPILSIALGMLDDDRVVLPTLSRGQILDFLENHYVSVQARISVDPITSTWKLGYRPIACQTTVGNAPRTQKIEPAIESTINDMRGLGILKSARPTLVNAELKPENASGQIPEPTEQGSSTGAKLFANVVPQTAVWLYRSEWMEPGAPFSSRKFEYVFVHARPSKDVTAADPWELHVIVTSDQRKKFHYFAPNDKSLLPSKPSESQFLANVHFTKYGSGGLSPLASVTRSLQIKHQKTFSIDQVTELLNAANVTGAWTDNPESTVVEIINSN